MAIDSTQARPPHPIDGTSSFAVLGTDFVDVLALFVRTIPIYPDGHGRVVAVSDRLQDTAATQAEPVVIEVADRGLIVDGKERVDLGPGPKALRESLLATAVVRVTIQPSAPSSSYVLFARALQRNARLAAANHLSFADLWMAPIPGIAVEELVFGAEGFAARGPDEAREEDSTGVLGSVSPEEAPAPLDSGLSRQGGDGSLVGQGAVVAGSTGAGDGPGVEATVAAEPPAPPAPLPPPRPRRMHTVSRDLRELVLEDAGLSAALDEVVGRLLLDGAKTSASGADILEHLVRALPIEARLDPAKGVRILRKVLERLLDQPTDASAAGAALDLPTRFLRQLERVFPRREESIEHETPAADDSAARAESFTFDELMFLDDSELDSLRRGDVEGPPPAPELSPDDGLVDRTALLLHAVLEEPAGDRRDQLKGLLLAAYAGRPRSAPAPCLFTHLSEVLAVPAASRDAARLALLASIAEEARVEPRRGSTPITADVAAELFPLCFALHLRGGGRAGAMARRIGRAAVLAASARLTAPNGALSSETLELVLAERTPDVLPFVEALLVGAPATRTRAVRAMRALDLKSLAAVALRVVPEERLTDRFLRGLCAEGFDGGDGRHLVVESAAALGTVVLDKEGVLDAQTRLYAIAALGSFPPALAEPALKSVAARRLMGGAPKELRRAAEDILKRFARAAAEARPIP